MTLLESGPARTDRNYWAGMGILFLGVCGWLLYDGAYGYHNKNRQQAEKILLGWAKLPESATERATMLRGMLGPTPTEADFDRLKAAWGKAERPVMREQVHKDLGQPVQPKTPDQTQERFASLYGMVTVPFNGERADVAGMQWTSWGKTPDDVSGQFYWAILPAVGAVYLFFRCFKAATLRAVIDEDGMTYGGVRIPFADMVSLRDYSRKGWVDLYYQVRGNERKLRIDNQKIAKFDEIAELICQKKGFENPIKAALAEAAARERDAAAVAAAEEAGADPTLGSKPGD